MTQITGEQAYAALCKIHEALCVPFQWSSDTPEAVADVLYALGFRMIDEDVAEAIENGDASTRAIVENQPKLTAATEIALDGEGMVSALGAAVGYTVGLTLDDGSSIEGELASVDNWTIVIHVVDPENNYLPTGEERAYAFGAHTPIDPNADHVGRVVGIEVF